MSQLNKAFIHYSDDSEESPVEEQVLCSRLKRSLTTSSDLCAKALKTEESESNTNQAQVNYPSQATNASDWILPSLPDRFPPTRIGRCISLYNLASDKPILPYDYTKVELHNDLVDLEVKDLSPQYVKICYIEAIVKYYNFLMDELTF